ncbi:outer dynein arm-docking complex subunit 4-like [Hylaeus volcanicus]|uniref:outer dynein arm-docking complex subunit 4-like n=1 Tax=Hylaeus volcanicus TaxID=313075 RepID=UPI0023B7CCAF|nr:outer dynein arm-docking complex subunit 4-like [Hylaeus volcanicus]
MAKMKRDEGPEFFRDWIVYREWAYRFSISQNYPIAEIYFGKAIQQNQYDDFRTFLGLLKNQINYARYGRALKTTKMCASIEPAYSKVKELQLQSLFLAGEFGASLIHAHQGFQKRQTVALLHGIIQGNQTVEDCVGRNTHPRALQLLSPWIEHLKEHRMMMIEKLKEEVDEFEGIDEEQTRLKVNDPKVRATMKLRRLYRVIAKIYLDRLANDKEFLKKLTEYPEILESPHKESTKRLHHMATRNYWRAVRRQRILRMRQPLYVMMFERMAIPKGHKMMMEEEKKLRSNLIIIEADFLLRRLHDVRTSRDYITFFNMVDRVKDKFDSYSLKMFPLRQKCLDTVYNMVAWAYIDTRDLSQLQSKEQKMTYLKHHMGIRVAELPRDCDIAWIHSHHGKDALRVFRRRLAMASQPLELAWLFHELCKYLISINRYDLARFYGKKALDKGEEAGSEQWVLNSHHLFMRIEIVQNYRNEAKESALLALTSAKKLGLDFLVDFYVKMAETMDEMDMEKLLDDDAIAARQQLILDLMPEDMKPKVDFLWRSMDAVPAKRRLSVMPGCKPVDKKTKLPCKRMTILPSPAKDPELEAMRALLAQYEPSKERPGFVDFDEYD